MIAPSPLVRHDHDHQALSYSAYDGAYPHLWPTPSAEHQPSVFASSGGGDNYYAQGNLPQAIGVGNTASSLQIEIPDRTRSYSSPVKSIMNQALSPKSGQDSIVSSHAPMPDSDDPHSSSNHTQPHQPGPSSYTDEAAMDLADYTSLDDHLFMHARPASPSNALQQQDIDGAASSHDQGLQNPGASPSPSYPAPGTVNPMDIMPASTERELWYRNEHQFHPSYERHAEAGPSMSQDAHEHPHMKAQLHQQSNKGKNLQLVMPTADRFSQEEDAERDDVVMEDLPLLSHLNAGQSAGQSRRMSYSSDHAAALPATSTNASSHNTPSTMLDSPSPESASSSDFRYSASPQLGHSMPSPRNAIFRCDEPGCNQVFDQPHKLKHHQRYHSKDHKCTYPGCGKGFGTKTHLQRHINDRHEKKKKYHCALQGCDYSKAGGKAFPRKDNWKRHMTKIHNMDPNHLPEPVEVDP
ncbi:hypothetical protein B0I35DRAFT_484139 [Stachybotrys elegans]|uniref:C2H2-type domain-containing protein n=1 Tax=Stachybotrys elegans TaxID=80388 RepID=A0A8K0SFE7_9HYPO|nr:hypothetical protein B0I35DRAFT_484139 [Stachybotrys elegans]